MCVTDEDMIPCEFCGETFPAFALVHHQVLCFTLLLILDTRDILASTKDQENLNGFCDICFKQPQNYRLVHTHGDF